MKRNRREGGFTLVETAATVVVASVALVATAGAVTSGARLARSAIETRAAVRASKSMMERVRATSFTAIEGTFDDTTRTIESVGDGESTGTCAVSVEQVDTGSAHWLVLQVTVTTRWAGAGGETAKPFVTYVCDRTTGSSLGSTQVVTADTTTTSDAPPTEEPPPDTTSSPPTAADLRVRKDKNR